MERTVRFVVGMHEEVPDRLVIVAALLDELQVLRGNQAPEVTGRNPRPALVPVRSEGLPSAELEPIG